MNDTKCSYTLNMRCRAADLPPMRDVLVLGKHTPVGANGVVEAMQALSPGVFDLVKVEHPVIEAMLVRRSDLRKIPQDRLIAEILETVSPLMDESDALAVDLELEVCIERTFAER